MGPFEGRLSVSTPPAAEPTLIATARLHLKLDPSGSPESHPDDDLVTAMIEAARDRAEVETWRQLITATYTYKLDCFPIGDDLIYLPKPPLQTVGSIAYLDSDGASQTWDSSNYNVHTFSGPTAQRGFIELAYGKSWPTTRDVRNAVTITFDCGYGDAGTDVPEGIIRWMLCLIGAMYELREAEIAGTTSAMLGYVDRLLDPYRLVGFA